MLVEERWRLVFGVLEAKTKEQAMVRLEIAVPCILHLKNRVSKAIIHRLLQKGLFYRDGDKHATSEMVIQVKSYINEQLFGEPEAPSSWQFPIDDEGVMGEIKLSNWRARRIVDELDSLVDISISLSLSLKRVREIDGKT
jgi:hypothetical protein